MQPASEKQPLISVLTSVLNGAERIQQCIDSVVAQTYDHKELIIIDGGSNDGTTDILAANSKHITYWKSEPDRSLYHAFNKAVRKAKGDWIIFLGADDYFYNPTTLSDMAPKLAAAHPPYYVVYGRVVIINPDGGLSHEWGEAWSELSRSLAAAGLAHQGFFHHRNLFKRYGEYNESFDIAGDYELLLRHLKSSEALYVPEITVSAYRLGGVSSCPENQVKLRFERRRALKMNRLDPGWMPRIERLLFGLHELIWRALGTAVSDRFLKFVEYITILDRKIRMY